MKPSLTNKKYIVTIPALLYNEDLLGHDKKIEITQTVGHMHVLC